MSTHGIFRHTGIAPNPLACLGGTPLVELGRLFSAQAGRVLAKLEFLAPVGPGARVAHQLLNDARREGRLGRHQTVVLAGEPVEAVASACAVLGHPLHVVLDHGDAGRLREVLSTLGAEVHVPDAPGRGPRADLARDLAMHTGGLLIDPSGDPSSFRAHRLGTAPELLRQTGGAFDGLVCTVRTGATFAGCSAAFHEFDPRILSFPVQRGASAEEPLPPLVDPARVARRLAIDDGRAADMAAELARREGLRVDLDGGAALAAARDLLEGRQYGQTLVVVLERSADATPTLDGGSVHFSDDAAAGSEVPDAA